MRPGEWASDPAPRGAGVLQVRKLHSGAVYYFRCVAPSGERVRIQLGANLPLAAMREAASELSRRFQRGDRDLRSVLQAEHAAKVEAEGKRQREVEAFAARRAGTLGVLLTAYADALERDGKPSHAAVRGSIRRHVELACPALWAKPAGDIDLDDLLGIVARVADAGKLREAGKIRSYLRAAYAAAISARHDPRALPALRNLRLTANPARDVAVIGGGSGTRDRVLSMAELKAYWRHISRMNTPIGAALRFHLLTGAQRIEQLCRLTIDNVDGDTRTIVLRDFKGRRKLPRVHVVPLLDAAVEAIHAMRGGQLGCALFTISAGERPVSYAALTHALADVVTAMHEAGELERGPFTPGDLRRTVETRLAAAGIGADVRAQLQSHGLGGVQARHYDRHDYLPEKRAALITLQRLLNGSRG